MNIHGNETMNQILIYDGSTGGVNVILEGDTVWLTLGQMAELFAVQKPAISKHLKNIFASGELDQASTVSKMEMVQQEGKRQVTRLAEVFNLDVIISVGYKVNSSQATRFRQWATRLLKQHLTQGYTLNQQRLESNSQALEAALLLVRKTAESHMLSVDAGRGLVDIITRYTQTFLWLQRYDEGLLNEPEGTTGGRLTPLDTARHAISVLKADLMAKGEASPLFALERNDGLSAIWGNLEQSVFGEPAYPTIEAKAAHLLYFVIKNHPLTDGNKRTAAFLFVDFLHRNQQLFDDRGNAIINDIGLAALALLVAESKPDDKDILIKLIMNMLTCFSPSSTFAGQPS